MFTKVVILLSAILAASLAQRPPYAGSNFGRPELANQFKNTQESTTVSFDNRIGSDGTTVKIPTDARGDVKLVSRLQQWPREHQPFWLLNAEHIEKQRHPEEPINNFGISQQEVKDQNIFDDDAADDDYLYDNQEYDPFAPVGPISPRVRSNFGSQDDVPSRPIRPAPSRPWFFGRT